MGPIYAQNFCMEKEAINKTKRQPTDWEKVFANDVTDKGLVSKIYKQLLTLIASKQTTHSKNGPNIWIDISLKSIYRWPIDTWKDVQNQKILEKCKSKLQWDYHLTPTEWLS